MLSNLDTLEGQFRSYLRRQYDESDSYLGKAVELLNDMVLDECPPVAEAPYDKSRTSVLSFNYTTPFAFENSAVEGARVVNIHGNLDGEIIFGVDGKECMGDPDALPFTKTYRVASMGVNMPSRLYATATGRSDGSRTEVIKFFGHSLGEADYSYFQAFFDGVDLYGGDTRLVFYYRPWHGKDENELHAETVEAVTKLLVEYGGTLDNKDHGKNLMHKLLLEGRLEVKRLAKRSW
jgi:hypothetical protein